MEVYKILLLLVSSVLFLLAVKKFRKNKNKEDALLEFIFLELACCFLLITVMGIIGIENIRNFFSFLNYKISF